MFVLLTLTVIPFTHYIIYISLVKYSKLPKDFA